MAMQRDNRLYSMTTLIMEGERYRYTCDDNKSYSVKIGTPAIDSQSDQGDYYCPLDIEFSDTLQQLVSFGINPLQALESAFEALRLALAFKANYDENSKEILVKYLLHIHTLPVDLAQVLSNPSR